MFAKATNGKIHFSGQIELLGTTTYLAVEDVETGRNRTDVEY